MNKDIEETLKRLQEFLAYNDLTIVRSAADGKRLVLSYYVGDGEFCDIEFEDEIGHTSIEHKWYKVLGNPL